MFSLTTDYDFRKYIKNKYCKIFKKKQLIKVIWLREGYNFGGGKWAQ